MYDCHVYCHLYRPYVRSQWNLGLYDGTLNSNGRVQVAIFISFVSGYEFILSSLTTRLSRYDDI